MPVHVQPKTSVHHIPGISQNVLEIYEKIFNKMGWKSWLQTRLKRINKRSLLKLSDDEIEALFLYFIIGNAYNIRKATVKSYKANKKGN